tara:strand:+ start:330 stop:716 length:387 start_codon:yes stop_codon:yes gene_type:complete
MKREIIIGSRVLFLKCDKKGTCKVHDDFLDFLLGKAVEFGDLMDKYGIPENVVLNFKKGSGDLAGIYHTQREDIRKHIIVIEIYTKNLEEEDLKELIDTFVHEVVHHKIKDDKEVGRIAKVIVRKLMK